MRRDKQGDLVRKDWLFGTGPDCRPWSTRGFCTGMLSAAVLTRGGRLTTLHQVCYAQWTTRPDESGDYWSRIIGSFHGEVAREGPFDLRREAKANAKLLANDMSLALAAIEKHQRAELVLMRLAGDTPTRDNTARHWGT